MDGRYSAALRRAAARMVAASCASCSMAATRCAASSQPPDLSARSRPPACASRPRRPSVPAGTAGERMRFARQQFRTRRIGQFPHAPDTAEVFRGGRSPPPRSPHPRPAIRRAWPARWPRSLRAVPPSRRRPQFLPRVLRRGRSGKARVRAAPRKWALGTKPFIPARRHSALVVAERRSP